MKLISFLLLVAGCYGTWHYYHLNVEKELELQQLEAQVRNLHADVEQNSALVEADKTIMLEYRQIQQKAKELENKKCELVAKVNQLKDIENLPEIDDLATDELNLRSNLDLLKELFNK